MKHHKKKIIDISVPIEENMPVWPGDIKPQLIEVKSQRKGDKSNDTRFICSSHAGTHIDAPRHFLEHGKTVDQIKLDILAGHVYVAYFNKIKEIKSSDLDKARIPMKTKRLLLKTDNSKLWQRKEKKFKKDFVALTPDAAKWMVKRGIKLVGIDYLSIQQFNGDTKTHKILLSKNIVIIECLNLSKVKPGLYEMLCLPLNIVGAEGASARTILRPLRGGAM
jgi:arylformamidase